MSCDDKAEFLAAIEFFSATIQKYWDVWLKNEEVNTSIQR